MRGGIASLRIRLRVGEGRGMTAQCPDDRSLLAPDTGVVLSDLGSHMQQDKATATNTTSKTYPRTRNEMLLNDPRLLYAVYGLQHAPKQHVFPARG